MSAGIGYKYKHYHCENGIRFFFQIVGELASIPAWLWKSIRGFRGEIITIEKDPYLDSHNWSCSALQIRENGKLCWHNCFFYPFDKVAPGDIVRRRFLGRIYLLRGGKRIKISGVY